MKNLLSLLIIAFLFVSCKKEDNNSTNNSTPITKSEKEKTTTSKSMNNIDYTQYGNEFIVFFDRSDDELYFLQLGESFSPIVEPSNLASNTYLDNDGETLIIEQPSGNIQYTFIQDEIIGIGHLSYDAGIAGGLISENNGSVIMHPNDNNYIPEIKCKCFGSGHTLPNNCTAGGQGATSCSASSGGNSCSVSCPYEIPCCTVDNNFTYN